jgi:hypothetical protein
MDRTGKRRLINLAAALLLAQAAATSIQKFMAARRFSGPVSSIAP